MPTTELTRALRTLVQAHIAALYGPTVGKVISTDMSKQRVTVQPVIRRAYADDDVPVTYLPSVIANVPILFFQGGSHADTVTPVKGDYGLLVFADRSLAEWKNGGGDDVTPQDLRRFDIADAVFIPGLVPFSSPLPTAAHAPGARVLYGDDIRLGSRDATDPLTLTSLVVAQLNAVEDKLNDLITKFNSHTHASVLATGPGVTGSTPITTGGPGTSETPVPNTTASDVAATKSFGE